MSFTVKENFIKKPEHERVCVPFPIPRGNTAAASSERKHVRISGTYTYTLGCISVQRQNVYAKTYELQLSCRNCNNCC